MGFSRDELVSRTLYRRAVEAVVWGMPLVSFDAMWQALLRDVAGAPNQVVYWSRLLDWRNQTLTPNPDAIYLMAFIDTRSGPVVLEIPAADGGSITGSIDTAWQTAIEDVGPAGSDGGKGGKYLVLPPGFEDEVPDGYIACHSETYGAFALLRSNLGGSDTSDVEAAVAYGLRVALYPLAEADRPSSTSFIDAAGKDFVATIPTGAAFFEGLNRQVQSEPWLARDKAMIDPLATIGIHQGSEFAPDADTREVLAQAFDEARGFIDMKYQAAFVPPFVDDAHWAPPGSPELVKGLTTGYADPDSYPVDARAVTYSMGFFSAKHLGSGQFYLVTLVDGDGAVLDGNRAYRLRVPANVPVSLYWSVTAYDRATHALIRDMQWASRSSNTHGLRSNDDGSVDIYFGDSAPDGLESNWIPTATEAEFELAFRFYGPGKPLFEKTWHLPDLERLDTPE